MEIGAGVKGEGGGGGVKGGELCGLVAIALHCKGETVKLSAVMSGTVT